MVSLQKGSDNLMKWSRQLRQVEVISTRARAKPNDHKADSINVSPNHGKMLLKRHLPTRDDSSRSLFSRPWIALDRGAIHGGPICDEKIQHGIPFRLHGIVSKSSALRRQ